MRKSRKKQIIKYMFPALLFNIGAPLQVTSCGTNDLGMCKVVSETSSYIAPRDAKIRIGDSGGEKSEITIPCTAANQQIRLTIPYIIVDKNEMGLAGIATVLRYVDRNEKGERVLREVDKVTDSCGVDVIEMNFICPNPAEVPEGAPVEQILIRSGALFGTVDIMLTKKAEEDEEE